MLITKAMLIPMGTCTIGTQWMIVEQLPLKAGMYQQMMRLKN